MDGRQGVEGRLAGRFVSAMLTPRGALAVRPADAALLNGVGTMLSGADPAAALPWFRRAVRMAPDRPEPRANLSAALLSLSLTGEALTEGGLAALLDPGNGGGWNNLGNALFEARDYPRALAAFRRARQILPQFADALVNEGGLRLDLGEAAEGARLSRLAVALAPHSSGAWNNLGNGLLLACRLAEADRAFRRAVAVAPDDAQIRFNHAAVLLKQGRLTEGWREYEWRRRTPAALRRRRAFDPPEWRGGDPRGATLLLSTEQGYGDALQFCRFAVWLAERGARVLLRTHPPLVRLLRSLAGVERVLSFDEAAPPFDYHAPVMSLPHLCGEMPVAVPYLSADPVAAARWRERLAALPGLKVGLAWSGDPRPGRRSAHLLDGRRSLRPEQFAGLARLPGISLVSLQKDGAPGGLAVTDWTAELADFADTAALVEALDLVISVDTSVAHLAGALGRQVCILSRFDGCWRWLEGRDDTPWYPGARLFRQTEPGDWSRPLAALAEHIVTKRHLPGNMAENPMR